MKYILVFLIALAANICTGQTPTSVFSVEIAGKDSLNRDSVWLIETVFLQTENGYTTNKSARLIVGKPDARNYLRALQDDLVAQKAKIDEAKAKRDQLEANVIALRQALNNAQVPAPRQATPAPTPAQTSVEKALENTVKTSKPAKKTKKKKGN